MRSVLLVLFASLSSGSLALAQDRLFIDKREVGALGHFAADLGPAPAWAAQPRFGGDRYVHSDYGRVTDLRTGRVLPLGPGDAVAFDRARPHVYLQRAEGIWLENVTTSWSYLVMARPTAGLLGCVHATSADILFCAFARPDDVTEIVRTSPFGARTVGSTWLADGVQPFAVPTADGATLYFLRCARTVGTSPICAESQAAAMNVSTGEVTAAAPVDGISASSTLIWDEVHARLFAVGPRIHAFGRDLRHLGSAQPGGRCRSVAISPHTDRLYLNVYGYYYGPRWAELSVHDAGTLRPLPPGIVNSAVPSCGPMTLVTAPGAPRDLFAVVSGRRVDLRWTNVGGASSFAIEAGIAPGRTDVTLFTGPEPRLTLANVPPGRYYVRVRGGNEQGDGRPSAEIVIQVR